MKKVVLALAVWVAVGSAFAGEYRDFTSADGKTIRGKVVKFDGRKSMVTIERDNKKRATVPIVAFSQGDQDYIREWGTMEGFLDENSLRVGADEKKVEQWKEENNATQRKYEKYAFEVTFDNRNQAPIGPFAVEYKIFYEQEENDYKTRKVITHQKQQKGAFKEVRLPAGGKNTLLTETVTLEKFEFNMSEYYVPGGDPESTSGDIIGIWIRMTVTTKSGEKVVRDVCLPEKIGEKYTW